MLLAIYRKGATPKQQFFSPDAGAADLRQLRSQAAESDAYRRPMKAQDVEKFEDRVLGRISAYTSSQYTPFASSEAELEQAAQVSYRDFCKGAYERRQQSKQLNLAKLQMNQMAWAMENA